MAWHAVRLKFSHKKDVFWRAIETKGLLSLAWHAVALISSHKKDVLLKSRDERTGGSITAFIRNWNRVFSFRQHNIAFDFHSLSSVVGSIREKYEI